MSLLELYNSSKQQLATILGASEDLLHVHAGLMIFFAAALILRRRMRSRSPIAVVYAFAIANEIVDAFSPDSSISPWEPLVDIVNTVVWPTLLFLLARRKAPAQNPATNAHRDTARVGN